MRPKDTTRTFFEKMGQISEGEEAQRLATAVRPIPPNRNVAL
jgi:hypothetical protein